MIQKTISLAVSASLGCLSFSSLLSAESMLKKDDRVVIIGNTFADQLRNHGYLETLLTKELNIVLKNLAWAGDSVTQRDRPTNFPAEEERLNKHKTDAIIACFGMGESFKSTEGIELFKSNLETLLQTYQGKTYNGKSPVKLILVSPIAYENHGYTTPNVTERNLDLANYSKAMEAVAQKLKIDFVDLYKPTSELFSTLENTNLTSNGIHLNEIGYWAISGEFHKQLTGADVPSWSLNLDAKSLETQVSGLEIQGMKQKENHLTFQVHKKNKPTLAAPKSNRYSSEVQALKSDKLKVKNLNPGSHTLTIDGKKIITASAEEWAKGVVLDQTPTHNALEELRQEINNKNLQFIYSWKALNQVHIVGERKSSKSGRALPAEIIKFNEISKSLQQKVLDTPIHETSEWSISPATPE